MSDEDFLVAEIESVVEEQPVKKKAVSKKRKQANEQPKQPKPKKPKKQENGAKFKEARRIFKERKKQFEAISEKIRIQQEGMAVKIENYDKMTKILKEGLQETQPLHKSLKTFSKKVLTPKSRKELNDPGDILKKLDDRMHALSKAVNVAIRDLEFHKKSIEKGSSEFDSIKKSINEFVNQMLADQQKMAEDARKYSIDESGGPSATVVGMGLVTDIFRLFKHPIDTKLDKVYPSKAKNKGKGVKAIGN